MDERMTNGDPRLAYLALIKAEAEAAEKMDEIVSAIRAIADGMKNWRDLDLPNTSIEFSAGPLGHERERVSLRDWPTGEQIARLFGEWHSARDAVVRAWRLIPTEQHRGLSPPAST